ncbi:cytochrome P450 [Pholiota conissans]|uniref:Cytochrome P450 n=1 Tax=Pholiota conissans TaxID=109636 RepID=A0A9P5YUK9_9AGAR|nr:cytochrome P450 [Pholiota conissans]
MFVLLLSLWKYLRNEHSFTLYAIILVLTYIFWKIAKHLYFYPRFFSPLRGVPGPPLDSMITGQFGEIIRGEAGIPQRAWVKQYGPVVRVVGPIGIERLIFMNPEAIHKILVTDWMDYPRPKFMRDVLGFATGHGLLTVSGHEHKHMRKAVNPAFSLSSLISQNDTFYDAIEGLVNIIDNHINDEQNPHRETRFPMYEWLSKATLDIICAIAFGYNSNSLQNPRNELVEAYEILNSTENGADLACFIAILSIPGMARLLRSNWATKNRHIFSWLSITESLNDGLGCMETIRRVVSGMLSKKKADSSGLQEDAEVQGDIMNILLQTQMRIRAQRESVKAPIATGIQAVNGMNDEEIVNQVLTFLSAGHETTASGLAWTLWLLAKDPATQKRLRKEVTPVFTEGARPGYRELKDLQWLDCVVQESLRVMPPVPMTLRQAAKTDYIDGVVVPKGTFLYIPIRVINTWKKVWGDDAEEFNPGRWLNLPQNYNSTTSALSFIVGPHACIGKTMAIFEMKAFLGALISNFEFEPAYEGQVPQPAAAVIMKPMDKLLLCIRRVVR